MATAAARPSSAGIPRHPDPSPEFGLDTRGAAAGEALIREFRQSAAMVHWLAARVAALPEDDLTWGVGHGG